MNVSWTRIRFHAAAENSSVSYDHSDHYDDLPVTAPGTRNMAHTLTSFITKAGNMEYLY